MWLWNTTFSAFKWNFYSYELSMNLKNCILTDFTSLWGQLTCLIEFGPQKQMKQHSK